MSVFLSKKDGKNKKPSQEFSSITVQIAGIFLATVGILWLLSLVTFSPADPVLLFPHSPSQLVADNAVGLVGSTAAFSLLKVVGGGIICGASVVGGIRTDGALVGTAARDDCWAGGRIVSDPVRECFAASAIFTSSHD